MLLEEFEDAPGIIEPSDRQIQGQEAEVKTIILSFNGEILDRLLTSDAIQPAGYLILNENQGAT